ncbi:MAG: PIG-L family deacetylase [Candidatus Kerfeldbacteria bacterium]|nr:PIG-L family deacetylase [Candidatus Kerfeldbacteria bacterium]
MMRFSDQTILVIAPHPDDEVFGCGGLISRAKREGAKVHVLYMTVGTTQDFSRRGVSTQDERLAEIERVAKRLGFDNYRIAFPGNNFHLRLDMVPQKDLIHAIERGAEISLESLQPSMVITCSPHDYNQDHRAVHEATITATRPAAPDVKSFQPLVLMYDHPSNGWTGRETVHAKNLFIALDEQDLTAKLEALKLYPSQLKHSNNPLSVDAVHTLATLNGFMCGTRYAEAFFVKRIVV